jgi:hypothetical protein
MGAMAELPVPLLQGRDAPSSYSLARQQLPWTPRNFSSAFLFIFLPAGFPPLLLLAPSSFSLVRQQGAPARTAATASKSLRQPSIPVHGALPPLCSSHGAAHPQILARAMILPSLIAPPLPATSSLGLLSPSPHCQRRSLLPHGGRAPSPSQRPPQVQASLSHACLQQGAPSQSHPIFLNPAKRQQCTPCAVVLAPCLTKCQSRSSSDAPRCVAPARLGHSSSICAAPASSSKPVVRKPSLPLLLLYFYFVLGKTVERLCVCLIAASRQCQSSRTRVRYKTGRVHHVLAQLKSDPIQVD